MTELHLILLFMIAAALIAVEVKDLLSGVIAIGAVGIGLCMAFLLLKAPDLAIMQLVVEVLSLIILIRATIRRDIPFSTSGRWVFNTVATLLFIFCFIVGAYFSIKDMPPFGNPLMRVSRAYMEVTPGVAKNLVASITLDFRPLDTLGEVAAIFTAVIGVLAVARKVGHEKGKH